MKKIFLAIIILSIIATTILTVPYLESRSICQCIRLGETEKAILKVNNMKMVNCGTYPKFMNPVLNLFGFNNDLPLVVACSKGDYEVAETLLKKGADPNKYYTGGFTATEAVIVSNSQNELEMLTLLTSYGADVTYGESTESPMFEMARKMIYTKNEQRKNYLSDCILYLLQFDKELVDRKGYSILYYAVTADNVYLTKELLSKENQLINYTAKDKRTVLFKAVENNSLVMAKLLIENGVDKTVVDSAGKTAYDYAVEKKDEKMVELLKTRDGHLS